MTVKSDRWIRQMAQEQGMIEPFEPGQVKNVDGERVVSFGTSSYGYDIRCSDEFKIRHQLRHLFLKDVRAIA